MKRVNFRRMVFVVLLSVLALGIAPLGLEAFQIEYQFTGTGEVIVAGTEYENTDFLISLFGDTENVFTDSYGSLISVLTGTIDLSGESLGSLSGDFLDNSLYLFTSIYPENRDEDLIAFGTNYLDSDLETIVGFFYTNIGSYMLNGNYDPINFPGPAILSDIERTMSTTFGQLTFEYVESASFQASEVTQSVPEPASLILMGSGLLALAGLGRRIRK